MALRMYAWGAMHKRAFMTNGTLERRNPIYLDELTPGRRFSTQSYALGEAELKNFAAQLDPPAVRHSTAPVDSVSQRASRVPRYRLPCRSPVPVGPTG